MLRQAGGGISMGLQVSIPAVNNAADLGDGVATQNAQKLVAAAVINTLNNANLAATIKQSAGAALAIMTAVTGVTIEPPAVIPGSITNSTPDLSRLRPASASSTPSVIPGGGSSASGLAAGAIAGIVIGAVIFVALLAVGGYMLYSRQAAGRNSTLKPAKPAGNDQVNMTNPMASSNRGIGRY